MIRNHTDITLLVAPFGFGSLGKALAIAEELISRELTVQILCDPVAQKVVKESGIPAGGYAYRETLKLDSLNTDIVISSGDVGTPVVKGATPYVVVDSLFWLRGRWERLPSSDADIYIAQRFFIDAPEEAEEAIGSKLRFVDAILPRWALANSTNKHGDLVVVYPGGMRSPVLSDEYQEKYLGWVGDVTIAAMEKLGLDLKNLVAVIPPQLIGSEPAKNLATVGRIVPAGVNALSDLFKQARCLVVAPGIETMLEASAMGITPHYLPAYNGSHIPQLIAYRQAGVGDEICPSYAEEIRSLEANTDWLNKLTMDLSAKNLESLSKSSFKDEATAQLVSILKMRERKVPKYPLGKEGAAQIADIVSPLLKKELLIKHPLQVRG